MKKTAIIVLTSIFLISSGAAFADSNRSQCQHKHQHKAKHMHGKLMALEFKNLNQDQKQQLRTIRKDNMQKALPLIKQLQVAKIELNAAMVKPDASMETLQPMIEKIKNLKGQLLTLKVNTRLQVYKETGILLPMRK